MKTKLTTLVFLLISITMFAQQGINYKALIKDDLGNVLVGQDVTLRFTIFANNFDYYSENHSTTTDDNGIVIVNIGEGTSNIFGNFLSLPWSYNDFSLKVEIDITGGTSFSNIGSIPFMAVPYAKHATTAQTAQVANNLSGLEQITENGKTGWRMIGASTATRADIGNNAIDMSYSGSISTPLTNGATGESSFAIGVITEASGDYSTAMGNRTDALGDYSTAMGFQTIASGSSSTAMGSLTTANSYAETAIGLYDTNYTPASTINWIANDRIFNIGNGINGSNRSNALTVLKNGTITAPSLTNSLINTAGNKALITKEYADTNYLMTGGSVDISIEGELQQTSTGNANLVPLAYGIVESTGNVLSGTGNFTAFLSGNVFIIDVNGTESLSYGNTVSIITPISTSARTSSTILSDGNGDSDVDLNVRIFNASGTQVTTTFQFVIYKL